jgi:two-component system chemotaxis response regulator CheY
VKQILIVDDAATVRMYHRGIFEDAGYRVLEAANGVEALEKTLAEAFDLFVVDVNMPQLDGFGFLRALRVQDLPQAPAIMVTTEAEDGDRRQAFEAGANLYLVKPAAPAVLLRYARLLLGEAP